MRYFQKLYPKQPYILSNGKGFLFPATASGVGSHATENPALIAEFETAMKKKIGGITEISADQFEELKKKTKPKSLNEAFSPAKIVQLKLAHDQANAAAAANNSRRALTPISRSLKKPNTEGRLNANPYKPGTAER